MSPKYGGSLRIKLPLAVGSLDPHALNDPSGALFAAAIFDTLYAIDGEGKPFSTLAAALPEATAKGARIVLRPGLTTALGKPVVPKDLVYSWQRCAERGGRAWLSPFEVPELDPQQPDAILIPNAQPDEIALALASPITAIVPRGFNRLRPDGTGAFRARPSREGLTLERNDRAARGPAFLDRVEVTRASDLSDALRAFETGEADIGWLGKGLHHPRIGAKRFAAGKLGWVVLYTGSLAGTWDRPGVAQRLVDELPVERLKHLGLERPWPALAGQGWGGPEGQVLVDQASPQLLELARSVAALLSRPSHRLSVTPHPRAELEKIKHNRGFMLLVDFVRCFGDSPRGTTAALYAAADPELAKNPPRLQADARTIARALSLGVVGELHAYGAHMPALVGLQPWDLGASWWAR